MAVAVVAVGTAASIGVNTATPGLPAGWQPDHIHVLVIESENEPVPTMTGWTNVGSGSISLATGTVTTITVRWRRAVAGDTNPTVPATANHTISRIIGFSGCPTTGDPWDTGTGAPIFATENVSDTTVSFPTLTTGADNEMIVHAFTTGQDTTTAQSSGAGTNAALTGLANRMNNWTNASSGGGFAMITGVKATAGSIGTTTTTVTTANVKCLFTGALKEAAAPLPGGLWRRTPHPSYRR
jgi:hypothetical protein